MRALAIVAVLGAATLWARAFPQRIVSTAPSLTETLFALGLGARIVGDTTFCNYPPAAKRLPRIGTFLQPNLEMILSLRPDLVVVIKNPSTCGSESRRWVCARSKWASEDNPAIYESIRRLGDVTGVPGAAAKLAGQAESWTRCDSPAQRGQAAKARGLYCGPRSRLSEGHGRGRQVVLPEPVTGNRGRQKCLRGCRHPVSLCLVGGDAARNPEVIIDMGDMAQTQGVTEAQSVLW